jgi:hypothetical protein
VGLNLTLGLRALGSRSVQPFQVSRQSNQASLVDTAIVVAEATDATTASQFARQLAVMTGRELTVDEAAEIDAAAERASRHAATNGYRG